MAPRLANLHQRNHLVMSYKPVDLREQHGNLKATIGGGLRLFGRPDDLNEDEEPEEHDVCRIRLHLPVMLRSTQYRRPAKSDQSDPRDSTPLPKLDSPGLHLRDSDHWDFAEQIFADARVPEYYLKVLDGDRRPTDRTTVLLR